MTAPSRPRTSSPFGTVARPSPPVPAALTVTGAPQKLADTLDLARSTAAAIAAPADLGVVMASIATYHKRIAQWSLRHGVRTLTDLLSRVDDCRADLAGLGASTGHAFVDQATTGELLDAQAYIVLLVHAQRLAAGTGFRGGRNAELLPALPSQATTHRPAGTPPLTPLQRLVIRVAVSRLLVRGTDGRIDPVKVAAVAVLSDAGVAPPELSEITVDDATTAAATGSLTVYGVHGRGDRSIPLDGWQAKTLARCAQARADAASGVLCFDSRGASKNNTQVSACMALPALFTRAGLSDPALTGESLCLSAPAQLLASGRTTDAQALSGLSTAQLRLRLPAFWRSVIPAQRMISDPAEASRESLTADPATEQVSDASSGPTDSIGWEIDWLQ